MSRFHAFQKLRAVSLVKQLGVSLAVSVVLATVSTSLSVAQPVGPQPPQARPQQDNQVTKMITKLMNKKKEAAANKDGQADAADSTTNAMGATGQASAKTGTGKPKVTAPANMEEMLPEDMKRPTLLTQPPLTNAKIEEPQVDTVNPPILNHPRLDDPTNPLGFADAENKLKKYVILIDGHRYLEAKPGLTQLRQGLVDLTEAHIGLYKTLNQVPSARGQAELEKELALQFAQLRDRAMLEMAKIYVSEKDYPRAVKELTDVVKSQPRSKMGLRSYELLQEIGFTEKLQLTQ